MAERAIRVLIVDDDVPTRVGLDAILSSEDDIEVVGEAASGEDATELVGRLGPDVVLMDVRLPGVDGIEATRRITQEQPPGTEPPRVIVLTTFDVPDYVRRSLRAGASGFLLKRTRAEDLVDAVRAVAHGDALPMPPTARAEVAARTSSGMGSPWIQRALRDLTAREAQVLILVARGLSNQEIAGELMVSVETVKSHVKHIYTKVGIRDRAQAVAAAYEGGLMEARPAEGDGSQGDAGLR